MTDTKDAGRIAKQLRELADELESGGENDLPVFNGYQMVEKVAQVNHLTVWRDEQGDAFIEDSAGEAEPFIEGISAEELCCALEEANR